MSMWPRRLGTFSLIATVNLALAGTGCSTTASISRGNGPAIESKIVDGDPGAVFVQSDNRLVYRLDRRNVAEIDHPGNVHMTFGAIALGTAAALFIPSFRESDPSERQDRRTLAASYALIGLPLALWGGYVYTRSRGAEQGKEPRPLLVHAMPEEHPAWPPVARPRAPAPSWPPPTAPAPSPTPAPAPPAAATPSAEPAGSDSTPAPAESAADPVSPPKS